MRALLHQCCGLAASARRGRSPLLLALLVAAGAHAAEGFKARGFILPDGAVKIDEDRFRLSQPWDEALKFYRKAYPSGKFPRHNLRSQTPIRAIHIENPSGVEWDGVNIYEASRGEVRLYILAGKEAPPESKKGGGKSP
jgi:hypothetical protein